MSLEQINTDMEFASMMSSELSDVYLPENEIYGRSLSTMRKLGTLATSQTNIELTRVSPEAEQALIEFTTSIDEGFGTDMELGGGLMVRDFDMREIIDGKVMAKDLKTAISDMTHSGIVCADAALAKDERFRPQHVRSQQDHQNALNVDAMAAGETDYNTTIVASPFPEEAAAKSGDKYWRDIGYVPHLRRGFVQVYHVTDDGKLLSGSLSFDGSDKSVLREVFYAEGVDIPEGEITDNWLKHAITKNLTTEAAKKLGLKIADAATSPEYRKTTNTVDVTTKYKPLVRRVFDESYIHVCESLDSGKQTGDMHALVLQLCNKADSFNDDYKNALYRMRADKTRFTAEDSIVMHELLVYSTIEMMRSLHLKDATPSGSRNTLAVSGFNSQVNAPPVNLAQMGQRDFQNMLGGYGAVGAEAGRTYSACGLSISAGDDKDPLSNTPGALMDGPQNTFGGADKEGSQMGESDGMGPLKFKCTKGHENVRPKNKLIEKCTTCGEQVSCGQSVSEAPEPLKISAQESLLKLFGVEAPKKDFELAA